MPIVQIHPAVRALDAMPYTAHLVGSRALNLHREGSDHDYLLVAPSDSKYSKEYEEMERALAAAGFVADKAGRGYGPDPSAEVWTWPAIEGTKMPGVDVIIVSREEFDRRIATLAAMRNRARSVEEMGRFYRAMKAEKGWPLFWATVRELLRKD